MPPRKTGLVLDELTRGKIAACLPEAIDQAIRSYRLYTAKEPETGPTGFGAYHTACKAAIAHLQLLLKLAAWADVPATGEQTALAALMADAEGELARYRAEAEGGEDEGGEDEGWEDEA